MRKLKDKSVESQFPAVKIDQTNFGVMYNDIPASEMPEGVAELENAHSYGEWIEGRTGSKEHTSLKLPPITDFQNITASQTGNLITRISGPAFTNFVIGYYFVWPGQPDRHYEIVDFIDADTIQVSRSDTRSAQSGCWMRGKVHWWKQHKVNRKIVMHIDRRVFWTTTAFAAWNQATQIGYWNPIDDQSYMYEFDERYMMLVCRSGLFKVFLDTNYPYLYKMNSNPPELLITSTSETETSPYGRRYSYSCSRLVGNIRWRYTKNSDRDTDRTDARKDNEGTFIEQESGLCRLDENGDDFGERFTQFPIGTGETTERINCGSSFNQSISAWKGITDGTFRVTIGGGPYGSATAVDIECDFSNVATIEDVALTVQAAMRSYFPEVVVEILTTGPKFLIWASQTPGATISLLSATGSGTDISDGGVGSTTLRGGAVGLATVVDANINQPLVINTLQVAPIHNGVGFGGERHWTHYSVYGSRDTGPAGRALGIIPDFMSWIADIPIAKAYRGAIALSGGLNVLTLTQGKFSQYDVGSTIEGEDGTRGTITTVTSDTAAVVSIPSPVASQGWGLGNDLVSFPVGTLSFAVFTASITQGIMTISSGHTFSSDDENQLAFLADGSIVEVEEVLTGATARIREPIDKTSQTVVMHPDSRSFNDRITDTILEDRSNTDVFTPDNRFFIELPNPDIGVIVPSFIAVARFDESKVYYSPIRSTAQYWGGSYLPNRHVDDKTEDNVRRLKKYPDLLVIQCTRTTWTVPTNVPQIERTPAYGTVTQYLPTMRFIDNIGILHPKSAAEIDIGQELMITSEPAIRLFDGASYSEVNIADRQVMKTIKRLTAVGAADYNHSPEGGYVIYGTEVE